MYDLTFTGTWTTAKNATRPGNAHFSPLIGATHNGSTSLLSIGGPASTGIENMAETGNRTALTNEINAFGASNANLITRDGIIGAEESVTIRISVDSDRSFVTFVSMIAPSPDWFVGLHDVNLQNNDGSWKSSLSVDLNSYDAGTENGTGFSTSNPATNPVQNIAMLDTAEPSGALLGAGSIANITFTQVSAVPEPSSSALLGLASLSVLMRRRR